MKTKLLTAISTVGGLSVLSIPAFAAKNLEDMILGLVGDLGSLLTSVFAPICILVVAIAILMIVIAKDPKAAGSAISYAKKAVICFVIFSLLGTLFNYAEDLVAGAGYDFGAL